MGWKDDRQLRHYASIFNQTVIDDIDRAFGKADTTSIKQKEIFEKQSLDDIEAFEKLLGI